MGLTLELNAALKESEPTDLSEILQVLNERHGALNVSLQASLMQSEREIIVPAIEIRSLGTFLSEIGTPPPMLVEDLIPENSLILISGKPKHAKSFMALDILEAVAGGQPVFGAHQVNRSGAVVYLGMEDGNYEIATRLLQRGHKTNAALPLHICTQRVIVSEPHSMALLRAELKKIQPVLIVVDTARESLGVKQWSDPAEVGDKIRALRDLAREVCSVLLVSHNRKMEGTNGDEIAGTNAFTSNVDGWLSIQKKELLPDGSLRLTYQKDGRALRGEGTVIMDTQTLRFRSASQEEIAAQDQRASAQKHDMQMQGQFRAVVTALTCFDGKATAAQLAEHLTMTQPTFSRLQAEMIGAGHLYDTGEKHRAEGSTGRGAALLTVPETSSLYSFMQNATVEDVNEWNDGDEGNPEDEGDLFCDAPEEECFALPTEKQVPACFQH